MKRILCLFIINLFFTGLACSQTAITPFYIYQPLTYNPSLAGSMGQDNVQISRFRVRQSDLSSASEAFIFSFEKPRINAFTNGVYISYVHRQSLLRSVDISYGAEFQEYRSQTTSANPTTAAVFSNVHFQLSPEKLKLSVGIKYDYIHRKAEYRGHQKLYGNQFALYDYDYKEFFDLFNTTGQEIGWSSSLQYYKKDLYNFSVGINHLSLRQDVIRDGILVDRIPVFENQKFTYAFLNVNMSVLLNEQLAIELNFLAGYTRNVGGGLTFRLGEFSTFGISYNFFSSTFESPQNAGALNFQYKNYNFHFTYSAQINKDVYFGTPNSLIKIGAGYSFGGEGKISLLRLD